MLNTTYNIYGEDGVTCEEKVCWEVNIYLQVEQCYMQQVIFCHSFETILYEFILQDYCHLHAEVVPRSGILVLACLGTFVVCVDKAVPEDVSAPPTERTTTIG